MVSGNLISTIDEQAPARQTETTLHAGDVSASEVWAYIQDNPAAVVDVRTEPEWTFSGLPALEDTAAALHCISWVNYPGFTPNAAFLDKLRSVAPDPHRPVFFLCKTGGRSHQAAVAATSEGYSYAYNILHGFEGDHNELGQRGHVNGWKGEGLPWNQA